MKLPFPFWILESLVASVIVFFSFLYCSLILFVLILVKASPETKTPWMRLWHRSVLKWFRLKLSVSGFENYNPHLPMMLISNHQSHLDISTIYAALSGNIRMVAKAELFKIPIFGYIIKNCETLELHRESKGSRLAVLSQIKALVTEKKLQVWLAPEGTRSKDKHLLPFKRGAFNLAKDLDIPIVPMIICGTFEAMNPSQYLVRPSGNVSLQILKPRKLNAEIDLKEQIQAIWNEMNESIKQHEILG